MFEDELIAKSSKLPALFYEIADEMPGVTAQDLCDAVLAAWEAAPEHAADDQITLIYRKFLLPVIEPYAAKYELSPESVCDALLTCAQLNDAVEQHRVSKIAKASTNG